jgi:hypothetical protein
MGGLLYFFGSPLFWGIFVAAVAVSGFFGKLFEKRKHAPGGKPGHGGVPGFPGSFPNIGDHPGGGAPGYTPGNKPGHAPGNPSGHIGGNSPGNAPGYPGGYPDIGDYPEGNSPGYPPANKPGCPPDYPPAHKHGGCDRNDLFPVPTSGICKPKPPQGYYRD